MTTLIARKAYLPDGWTDNVQLRIEGGRIAAVQAAPASANSTTRADLVMPGFANAHSHAFQRLLAGHTEVRGPAGSDDFWSWRKRMYELANAISATQFAIIARQLYSEMLAAGYTSVAEFHYLHRDDTGDIRGDAMLHALADAAAASGIRLTYVPVYYERAGFTRNAPEADQRRFTLSIDEFVAHYERARERRSTAFSVGIGVHSLRAASVSAVHRIADIAARDGCPMHLHIAEQASEVAQCLEAHGKRPVALLLDEFAPGTHWCLVHATHVDPSECAALARTGAVVCLCPSTEANLGDGVFPLPEYLGNGGRIAIGSDSHVSINPFEELRWLEYGQRLVAQTRNIAATATAGSGHALYDRVQAGGKLACGNSAGQLAVGESADLITLNRSAALFAGHSDGSLLDALVFTGLPLPIDRVMAAGNWCVREGVHVSAGEAAGQYAAVATTLGGTCGARS